MLNTYYRGEPVTPSLGRAPACPFARRPARVPLLHRFPALRLAVAAEELSLRTGPSPAHDLLVTWE